jgi:hypothetical protein
MKALRLLAVGLVAVCALACSACHHKNPVVTPQPTVTPHPVVTPNAVVMQWMRQDCRAREEEPLEPKLKAGGEAAEQALLRYYDEGSEASTRSEVEAAAGRDFDVIMGALNAQPPRTYGLSRDEVASIRAQSRPEYILEALEDFNDGFRVAALDGLAVVGRPEGVALLRRIAADHDSPDREAAIAALKSSGIPVTPP